jgi:hypothetical protein
MRLPDQETDELVRDYVVGELMALQRMVDSWADAENQKADELEKSFVKDHFAIARCRERAAAGQALEKIIDGRRQRLDRRYNEGQVACEINAKARGDGQ